MGMRQRVGRGLEATLGEQRTNRIRSAERRVRRQLSDRLAPPPVPAGPAAATGAGQGAGRPAPVGVRPLGEPNDRQGGWVPSDPFVKFPRPPMSRHDLLRELHRLLVPRTYLEIGVNTGASLQLSRARSVAVDPEFSVRYPLHCDVDLVRAKSDAFFQSPDALAHFQGTPVDLAFIDGMHLSEFAFRDFVNVERHLDLAGVAVIDDVMPRNALEAARVRLTGKWAGDVYKSVEVIARHRPDLLVLMINTSPTGTAIILGADPSSDVLEQAYPSELPYFEAADPQSPPQEYMARTVAVDPEQVLGSPAWPLLVKARESGDSALVQEAMDALRALPRLG